MRAQPLVELRAKGHGRTDPFVTAVLNAYVRAEQMRAFNRLLLRRIAVLGLAWLVVAEFILPASVHALFLGLGVLAAGAIWGAASEHRAAKGLRVLLSAAGNHALQGRESPQSPTRDSSVSHQGPSGS